LASSVAQIAQAVVPLKYETAVPNMMPVMGASY